MFKSVMSVELNRPTIERTEVERMLLKRQDRFTELQIFNNSFARGAIRAFLSPSGNSAVFSP